MANQVLNHAIEHVFERKSVVPEHELLNVALTHRLGEVDLNHLKAGLKYSPALVKPNGAIHAGDFGNRTGGDLDGQCGLRLG